MNVPVFFSAICLALSLSNSGFAQTLANIPGSSEKISGKGPTNTTLKTDSTENAAIFGVYISENQDDPCYIEVLYKNLTTLKDQTFLAFSDCFRCDKDCRKRSIPLGRNPTTVFVNKNATLPVLGASYDRVALPSGAFVTGVRVCLNQQRDKLKGIELKGNYPGCILGEKTVTILEDKCVQYKSNHMDYGLCDNPKPVQVLCGKDFAPYKERPNCRGPKRGPDADWEPLVSCPAKSVATGIELRVVDGGDSRMINGVALICDMLVP